MNAVRLTTSSSWLMLLLSPSTIAIVINIYFCHHKCKLATAAAASYYMYMAKFRLCTLIRTQLGRIEVGHLLSLLHPVQTERKAELGF